MTMLPQDSTPDPLDMDEIRKRFTEEFHQEIQNDLQLVKEGKIKEAIFLQTIAFNWPLKQLINVARQRGRNWSFLAAFGDTLLTVESIGIRRELTAMVRNNLHKSVMVHTLQTDDFIRRLQPENDDDPMVVEMIARHRRIAQQASEEIVVGFMDEVRKIWG